MTETILLYPYRDYDHDSMRVLIADFTMKHGKYPDIIDMFEPTAEQYRTTKELPPKRLSDLTYMGIKIRPICFV